ncbi:MAG: hypothetical protein J6S85_01715 [Methanobrevibacter sp.]|nr:hypothetical protein [Methanobrevibacter sp.]MBO7712252.1 hypothetical protein [Methanobrevibacter sp.]
MAINKSVENEYGAQFNYHKVREVRIINGENGVQLGITVYSWINKEARINGKEPTVRRCIIQGADFAMAPFYALLKAKFKDFASGEDDLDNSFKTEKEKPDAEYIMQDGQNKLIRKWKE